jgi:tetratricopeptide (TPR) repeat protein
MSEADRNRFIDNMIVNMEKEEERKKKELEAALNANASTPTSTLTGGTSPIPGMGNSTTYYFYNPTLVSFGIIDFSKKWGNRKAEDNWRRSNKAVVMEEQSPEALKKDSAKVAKQDSIKKEKKSRTFYMKDLPLTDSMMTKSNNRMIKAYYVMGSVYKEELNNNKKTILTFEELNSRFPDNRHTLQTYYSLYRIYLQEKNTTKADYYKNKILNEYPDSEFAQLIKNPDYAQELNAQKSEVEDYYSGVLAAYRATNFQESYSKSKQGIATYGKSEFLPKFEFIKSVSAGKLGGTDTLEKYLKLLVAKYPNSEVTPLSQDILLSIKKQKNPELFKARENLRSKTDTFNVNFDQNHFIVAVMPDVPKTVGQFKTNVGNFNTVFFNDKKFEITSNLFDKKQIVIIKSFSNAKEAQTYYENLMADTDVFKDDVKKSDCVVVPISADNMPILYRGKNIDGYQKFYNDNYKTLQTRN